MRANSSVSSLVVAVVALLSGCSPGGDPPVAVPPSEPPAPPAPAPVPTQPVLEQPVDDLLRNVENVRAAESQAQLNEIRERTAGDAPGPSAAPAVPLKTLDRLVYQCTGDVTFAVRVAGDRLEVFPPEHTHGYVVLDRVPSDDGVRYTAPDADFRAKDDLATLRIARQIYVDCISNPAASVWQGLPRRVGPIR